MSFKSWESVQNARNTPRAEQHARNVSKYPFAAPMAPTIVPKAAPRIHPGDADNQLRLTKGARCTSQKQERFQLPLGGGVKHLRELQKVEGDAEEGCTGWCYVVESGDLREEVQGVALSFTRAWWDCACHSPLPEF